MHKEVYHRICDVVEVVRLRVGELAESGVLSCRRIKSHCVKHVLLT